VLGCAPMPLSGRVCARPSQSVGVPRLRPGHGLPLWQGSSLTYLAGQVAAGPGSDVREEPRLPRYAGITGPPGLRRFLPATC
jgi:hypothetical protein